jgi:hypothetical protein
MSEIVHPTYRTVDSAEPEPIPLRELVAQRRARQDRMELEALRAEGEQSDPPPQVE